MLEVLQVFAVVLTGRAVVPALAHALELPGKMRLEQDTYLTVQTIYYPGFTVAGMAEPLSLMATLAAVLLTPPGGDRFWLTVVAAVGLIGMQAVYWLVTHPVNRVWLQGKRLSRMGFGFFSFASGSGSDRGELAWTNLRNRWEYSHVVRAILALLSLTALVLAMS
jgi:hypothetical protein